MRGLCKMSLFWSNLLLILQAFLALVSIYIIGFTFQKLLIKTEQSSLMGFVLSYGIGMGFISISLFLSILIGINAKYAFLIPFGFGMLLFVLTKTYKSFWREIKSIFRNIKIVKNLYLVVSLIFGAIILSYLFYRLIFYPFYAWDGLVMWSARAKYIYLDGNFNFLNYYEVHQNYPLLYSLQYVYFFGFLGRVHHYSKILTFFYYLNICLGVWEYLKTKNLTRVWKIFLSLLFATSFTISRHSITSYSDLALTYYIFMTTIFLLQYLEEEKKESMIYAIIFQTVMIGIKTDGLGVFILNGLILFVYSLFKFLRKKELKVLYKKLLVLSVFIIIPLLFYLPWQIICWKNGFSSEYLGQNENMFNFSVILKKLFIIILGFVKYMFIDYYWIIFFLILVFSFKQIKVERNFLLLLFIFSQLGLYLVVYLVTPADVSWQVNNSMDRMLLHISPIVFVSIGELSQSIRLFSEEKVDFSEKKIENLTGAIAGIILSFYLLQLLIGEWLISSIVNPIVNLLFT